MSIVDALLGSYGYTAVAAGVGIECLGVPIPGETVLIAAATYAGATQNLSTTHVVLVAAIAAIVGDNLGFWLGRAFGARLLVRLNRRLGPRSRHVHRIEALLDRRGGTVVMLGRFVSVARTYAAFLAGTRHMAVRRFVAYNAVGGIAWASLIGFGSSALGSTIGTWGSYGLIAAIGAGALGVTAVRRRRRAPRQHAATLPRSPNQPTEEPCDEIPISQTR